MSEFNSLNGDVLYEMIEKSSGLKSVSKDKTLKKENKKTNCCIAAVKYNTIGDVYEDLKNTEIYFVDHIKDGNKKTIAYCRCSKTISTKNLQTENKFCHLHDKMFLHNKDGLKIFDTDIVPKDPNDKTKRLALETDDFFINMGKRGAKKKHRLNIFTFKDLDDPILTILTHKNKKLRIPLALYAIELLKKSSDTNFKKESHKSDIDLYNSILFLKI